jgi:hypothetical protein
MDFNIAIHSIISILIFIYTSVFFRTDIGLSLGLIPITYTVYILMKK